MTPEQRANVVAVVRYQHDLEAALRSSASPRDWALSALVIHADERDDSGAADSARGALLRKAAEAARSDRLVQWTWAIAPDALSGCTAASACRNRGSALAKLEPDNGAAWLPVVADAVRVPDAAAIDDALAHVAASTRYDEAFSESKNAWLDIFRRFPPSPELLRMPDGKTGDAALVAESYALAQREYAMAPYDELLRSCHGGGRPGAPNSRSANCASAGRLMLDQSTTITGRMVGGGLLDASGASTSEDRERMRAAQWQVEQHMRLMPNGESDPARIREQMDLLVASDSEVTAMQEDLRRARVSLTPPAGWQPRQESAPQGGAGEPQPNPEPAPDHRPR